MNIPISKITLKAWGLEKYVNRINNPEDLQSFIISDIKTLKQIELHLRVANGTAITFKSYPARFFLHYNTSNQDLCNLYSLNN